MAGQCLITNDSKILINVNLGIELILKYRQNPAETYTYEWVHYLAKTETSFFLKINSFTKKFIGFGS